MNFKDLDIKEEYRSLQDDIIKEFYTPILKCAKKYQRAVGFFSSSALIEISKGISGLVKNGGKIELVASPNLKEEDIEAIKKGLVLKEDIINKRICDEIRDPINEQEEERLDYLANLIAYGILEIKIAVLDNKSNIGMYHEKFGIMYDNDENVIAFSGSMNESETAFIHNCESIDVFKSWNDYDLNRVKNKKLSFKAVWDDFEPGIKVMSFPKAAEEKILKYRKRESINYDIDIDSNNNIKNYIKEESIIYDDKRINRKGPKIPDGIKLRDYQEEAIKNWKDNDYRGIFDMATGTGKTFTGLGALSTLSKEVNNKLAVVIVCPYQHLVEQWVEDIIKFNIDPIIGYSSSPQKNWKKYLAKAIRDQKTRKDKSFFCFICTNATFKNSFVQEQLNKIKYPILLVVDEAHNFGAKSYENYLDNRFTYRLALSATLERHRDEEGTSILYKFFGKKCIEYSLEKAINEGKLTPYKYFPIIVHLNDDELEKYEQLSLEISKHIIKIDNKTVKLDSYGEILAIQRSRLIASASEKLVRLKEIMKEYKDEHFILVYCGATNVTFENSDSSNTDESDIRQIEAVTNILGNDLGMKVSKFTSEENIEERNLIKQHFKNGDDLQAIVAIKCLDEGVNIPGIKTAFILASTTNPKEYIQRRGRVLRKSPETGKEYAEIFDFVTLPRPLDEVSGLTKEQAMRDISLVKNELTRVREFGRLSMNSMESQKLIWDICDSYELYDNIEVEE